MFKRATFKYLICTSGLVHMHMHIAHLHSPTLKLQPIK